MRNIDRGVFFACKWGVILCIVALFLLLSAGVITRAIPFISIAGYDEIVELAFAWMTFLGAVALWRDGSLYRVMIISSTAPEGVRRPVEFFIRTLMLVLALVLTIKGIEFVMGSGETTPFLRLDKSYWYAAVPAAGLMMAVYSVVGLIRLMLGYERSADGGADLLS